MRFGTFNLAQWHESKSQRQVFQETIELIKVSEELGFDSAWLAEHHFSRYGLGSALLTLAAHLASVTKTIRLGTAVIVLPFYNPIALAEEIATLDILSGGRFELGVGRGYQWNEFRQFNMSLAESRARFDEALEIMSLAWREDEFDFRGQFWTFSGVNVLPKPIQKPHPPITVAASSPDGFSKAAEHGYSVFAGSSSTIDSVRRNLAAYRESLQVSGFQYDPAKVKFQRPTYVAGSARQARAETEEQYLWFVEAQRKVVTPPNEQWDLIPPDYRHQARNFPKLGQFKFDSVFDEVGVYGTPEECIRRIEEIDGVVGGLTEFICSFAQGGWDQMRILRSMELFARDVMPHFREGSVSHAQGEVHEIAT